MRPHGCYSDGVDRVVDSDEIAELVLGVAMGAIRGNDNIAARLRDLYTPDLHGD